MTYEMEGNCTGSRLQPFLTSPEVTQGHSRSPGVTEGQTSKIFKIGQMTYQMEGNCTGNPMQTFLGRLEVTQGHQGSPKVKNRKFYRVLFTGSYYKY